MGGVAISLCTARAMPTPPLPPLASAESLLDVPHEQHGLLPACEREGVAKTPHGLIRPACFDEHLGPSGPDVRLMLEAVREIDQANGLARQLLRLLELTSPSEDPCTEDPPVVLRGEVLLRSELLGDERELVRLVVGPQTMDRQPEAGRQGRAEGSLAHRREGLV